ncbi:MAG: hypothetical protein QG640_357 [Patescibacteria group bacterium]|jgi:hypothetical protein|nr:hypothetical protein [Patescibacteria group bacterium]
MNNKKIPTTAGAILLIMIAITVGIFVWAYEKGQDWGTVTIQPPVLNNGQKDSITEVALTEPMSEWKTYSDEEFGFQFKYPETFNVKFLSHYSIGDSSKEWVSFSVKKWKGYVIKENTPGTFWEKASYADWKYFSDNLKNIPLGKCSDEAISHITGKTVADVPKTCIISRQGDLLRVETDNRIIYFTKDVEIQWELNQDNKNLVDKITSTFVLK